ncbi:hypothetical protein AB840_03020 [Megasphaera cerevisiae DSM 20462]|uniref:Fimbrial assembly protein n=1 Tax=Megasphaera cerevisiae DSM 20462 TaxID=1122219 RepID=A0A0J6ZQZ4_9FIRM|nr:hypothetical protein [Megasphaera cerevisiae]KMO87376.1 hypothetical protein AB840_03020 [Megasphaera cerevisiae DSM 20462]MCI1749899.1 hypothetical protein [Megasphaera cerevisiae]OKY54825.1 hypothetical protein BSR42_00520 [Megasphaera cerevisiae]SJZ38873.1 Tfp pilus assembly protein PilN [Megasphaera cerevisiae DSM 20462]
MNLIPFSYQETENKKRYDRIFVPLVSVLVCMVVGLLITGMLIQQWKEKEYQYYIEQSAPIQQQVIRQNKTEKKMRDMSEAVNEKEKKRIHWPPVLVCLADTKPAGAIVQVLEVQGNHMSVHGYEAIPGAVRQWQEILRRQSDIQSVTANKLQKLADGMTKFQLEVELGYDEKRNDTP